MRSSKKTTTAAGRKPKREPAAAEPPSAAAVIDATDVLSGQMELAGALDRPPRLDDLREKYLELARKYTGVVALLERNAAQQAIVFRLGLWALNVSANALAVIRGNEVTMQNARWLQLDDIRAGGWIPENGEPRAEHADLSRLARTEAAQLPDRTPANAVRRYRRVRGDQVIEVKLERPASDGRVVLVSAHDITDQVRARRELSDTREALLQNEQLAVVGELASSVAHDLGNTLRGISARISVLASDGVIAQAQAPVIEGLRESVEAATAAVRNLQDVARLGRLDPGAVPLDDVVRRAAEIMELRQPHDAAPIAVRTRLAQLPPVLGTVSELSHVFMTLFFNARDAMPDGGTIDVVGRREKGRVRVTVTDSGTGFAPDALPHLFQPFFTTKGTAGTGLGLWLAQSTMRRFGGTIAARNRRGGGAEIEIELQVMTDGKLRQDHARERPREPHVPSS